MGPASLFFGPIRRRGKGIKGLAVADHQFPEDVMSDLIRDQGRVDWITRIPPKQSSWLEVRFLRNERLKGVRFAGGALKPGTSYRIETSIDGYHYQLCQSNQWPDSQHISDLAFNPGDDKALARSLRITVTSSRLSGEVSFSLRNIQVFASD